MTDEDLIDKLLAESLHLRSELDAARDELQLLRSERAAAMNRAGDDLCWIVDPEEAKALPEAEFIESCRRHRAFLASERGEFTEGLTIAQLEEQLGKALHACRVVKEFLDKLENGIPEDDRLRQLRREVHAPLQKVLIEALG